jgi:hypothetical protein
MGCCNEIERSEEENYVNLFIQSLPVKNFESDVFSADIVAKLNERARELGITAPEVPPISEDLIKYIQDKYFKSTVDEFQQIRLFEEYYNFNKSKYLVVAAPLLCDLNLMKQMPFIETLLQAVGVDKNDFFAENGLYTSEENMFALLRPIIDMLSRFIMERLTTLRNCPPRLKDKLEKAYSVTLQDELIKNLIVGEDRDTAKVEQKKEENEPSKGENADEEKPNEEKKEVEKKQGLSTEMIFHFFDFQKRSDTFQEENLGDQLFMHFNKRPWQLDHLISKDGEIRVRQTEERNRTDAERLNVKIENHKKEVEEKKLMEEEEENKLKEADENKLKEEEEEEEENKLKEAEEKKKNEEIHDEVIVKDINN